MNSAILLLTVYQKHNSLLISYSCIKNDFCPMVYNKLNKGNQMNILTMRILK